MYSTSITKMKPITKIFPSWESYTKSLELSMNTEFYFEEYPDYDTLNDNDIFDYEIVKHLLDNKYDPQKGFNLFVKACFNGSRYIGDVFRENRLIKCVNEFISKGAKIDEKWIKKIFTVEHDNFDDNEMFMNAKAALINAFISHIDINKYCADWENINADDWENDALNLKIRYMSYLKNCSNRLKDC